MDSMLSTTSSCWSFYNILELLDGGFTLNEKADEKAQIVAEKSWPEWDMPLITGLGTVPMTAKHRTTSLVKIELG